MIITHTHTHTNTHTHTHTHAYLCMHVPYAQTYMVVLRIHMVETYNSLMFMYLFICLRCYIYIYSIIYITVSSHGFSPWLLLLRPSPPRTVFNGKSISTLKGRTDRRAQSPLTLHCLICFQTMTPEWKPPLTFSEASWQ